MRCPRCGNEIGKLKIKAPFDFITMRSYCPYCDFGLFDKEWYQVELWERRRKEIRKEMEEEK